MIKYNKGTNYHAIYIRVFYDGTVSYLTVSTDDIINITNNETAFTEPRRVFGEYFKIKSQERYILKYLNLEICQSTLGLSVYQTDHIVELVNKWSPTGKFRKVGTPFMTDFIYEKELIAALVLTGTALHNAGM